MDHVRPFIPHDTPFVLESVMFLFAERDEPSPEAVLMLQRAAPCCQGSS